MWDSHWRHHPHGCVLGCTAGSPFDLAIFSFFWGIFRRFYGYFLMDVMRFSLGFFLPDFHDFAAWAKVSHWKNTLTFTRLRVLFAVNDHSPQQPAITSASATHPVQERKLSCWRLEHMPFLTEHPVEPNTQEKSLENTMIVIWTIEFTNGSFTKMELYGSKKGRVRPKMRSTPKQPFQ